MLAVSLPFAQAQTFFNYQENQNLYFRSDSTTIFSNTGYRLANENSYSTQFINSSTAAANDTIHWGLRVYLINDSVETELSPGVVVDFITLNTTYTGYSYGTWSFSGTDITIGEYAFKMVLYLKVDPYDWVAKATFYGDLLVTDELKAGTWTLCLYHAYYVDAGHTYSTAYFGEAHYASYIQVILAEPRESDLQMWRLFNADLIGFTLGPYIDLLGPAFYCLILFGICGSLYRRYSNAGIITIFFILLGGSGSILWIILPLYAIIPISILFILIGTFVLWRLIR